MVNRSLFPTVLVATLSLGAGWFFRGVSLRPVLAHDDGHRGAATESALAFELSGIGRDTSLTVYSAETHTLYVYPAISQGAGSVNCEFTLHLGRVGGPVQRTNCGPGQLLPDR